MKTKDTFSGVSEVNEMEKCHIGYYSWIWKAINFSSWKSISREKSLLKFDWNFGLNSWKLTWYSTISIFWRLPNRKSTIISPVSRKFNNFTENIKHFLTPYEASKPHETESQNIQTKKMKCISCEKTFRYSKKLPSHMILIHRTFKLGKWNVSLVKKRLDMY